jgi:hypothetical protein
MLEMMGKVAVLKMSKMLTMRVRVRRRRSMAEEVC